MMTFRRSKLPLPVAYTKGPSLAAMAVHVAQAAGRVAIHAITGQPILLPEPAVQARLAICRSGCSHHANGRCLHRSCGCFLSRKARLATETCPEGKWPAAVQVS